MPSVSMYTIFLEGREALRLEDSSPPPCQTALPMASPDLVRRRQHQEKSASAAHMGVVPPACPRAICLVLSFPKLATSHRLPGSWHSCQQHMWAWTPAPCSAQHLLSWTGRNGSAWVLWQENCDTPRSQDFIATGASVFSMLVSSWNVLEMAI